MNEGKHSTVLDPEKAALILTQAIPSVFAEMIFMDAVPVASSWGVAESENPADTSAAVRIAIDMLMPLSCRLELSMSSELADSIADTLYGGTDAESFALGATPAAIAADQNRADSTLELLNVFAGSFLSAYFGAGTPFKLELPFFLFGASEVSDPSIARVEFNVDGLTAIVTLRSIRYRY